MINKVRHIQKIASVILDINNLPEFFIIKICVFIHITISAQTHDLVFRIIYTEPKISCDSRIQQSNRMRKFNLFHQMNIILFTHAINSSGPLSYSVNAQDSSLIKRAYQERACSMCHMVVNKKNIAFVFYLFL